MRQRQHIALKHTALWQYLYRNRITNVECLRRVDPQMYRKAKEIQFEYEKAGRPVASGVKREWLSEEEIRTAYKTYLEKHSGLTRGKLVLIEPRLAWALKEAGKWDRIPITEVGKKALETRTANRKQGAYQNGAS